MKLRDPEYIREYLKSGLRYDGRKFDELRKIEIKVGYVKNAEGSCLVRMGNTKVLAGVKLEVGEPFPDTPDEGYFVVNVEYAPFSFEEAEPGPPGEDEIEIARVVDKVIRESGAIDLKKLCIEEGNRVWGIMIDIYVLNHDGNLIDTSTIAAVSALYNARFPKYDGERVIHEELTDQRIPIEKIPINITFAKIGGKILLDPIKLEEEVAESLFTVGVCDGKIHGIQKEGRFGMKMEEVKYCVRKAFEIYPKIRRLIEDEVLKGE